MPRDDKRGRGGIKKLVKKCVICYNSQKYELSPQAEGKYKMAETRRTLERERERERERNKPCRGD